MLQKVAMKRPKGFADCIDLLCLYLRMFVYMNIFKEIELVRLSTRRSIILCRRVVQVLHVYDVCVLDCASSYVCVCVLLAL